MSNPSPDSIPLRIVIAGGGTGGHLFPGLAIAQEFSARHSDTRVLFIGTDREFEGEAVSRAGFRHLSVTAEGIKGRGLLKSTRAALKIPVGLVQALAMLFRFGPDLVIGVGGYSSGPVILAAWILGKKIALQEQNLLPGITNRILARFADRIYVSFAESADRIGREKARLTGNPVRQAIIDAAGEVETDPQRPFTVLVIGGSQGAHAINLAVIESLDRLRQPDRYRFIHQTGEADRAIVEAEYRRRGVSGTVEPFFHDMARCYRNADLVICRAGATTVAEVTAIGIGIVFIPFPFAADDHQTLNAGSLADRGAAEMIPEKDLTGARLAEKIEFYARHPARLSEMALKARACGRPDAAAAIVDDCYRLIFGNPGGDPQTGDRADRQTGRPTEDPGHRPFNESTFNESTT